MEANAGKMWKPAKPAAGLIITSLRMEAMPWADSFSVPFSANEKFAPGPSKL